MTNVCLKVMRNMALAGGVVGLFTLPGLGVAANLVSTGLSVPTGGSISCVMTNKSDTDLVVDVILRDETGVFLDGSAGAIVPPSHSLSLATKAATVSLGSCLFTFDGKRKFGKAHACASSGPDHLGGCDLGIAKAR